MSIETSTTFKTDSGTNTQYIIPLIVFYKGVRADNFGVLDISDNLDKLFVSSQGIEFDGNYYSPLLNKVPDVKESIDLKTKQFRIKSAILDINNSEFHGERFSDNIKDIINCAVRIYYKTQSCKTLEDCSLIAQSTVLRFTQSKNNLKLTLEDPTQIVLQKAIPELVPDDVAYVVDDRAKPFPMVYGRVNRSPVVRKIDPEQFGWGSTSGDFRIKSLVADRLPISSFAYDNENRYLPKPVKDVMVEQSPLHIFSGDDYLNISNRPPREYGDAMLGIGTNIVSDTTPFFIINDGEITATDMFTNFQIAIGYEYGIARSAIGRVWREFVDVTGHRKAYKANVQNDTTFGGHLYAISDIEDDIWGDGTYNNPKLWWTRMWEESNYISKDNICFPFDTDDLGHWNAAKGDMNQGINIWYQGIASNDDEPAVGQLRSSWAIPNHESGTLGWHVKPKDYLDFIKHDDSRALAIYGHGDSKGNSDGSYVHWSFQLDENNVEGKAITYFHGSIMTYINLQADYSQAGVHEWLSGVGLWGSSSAPVYPNTRGVSSADDTDWGWVYSTYQYFPTFAPLEHRSNINQISSPHQQENWLIEPDTPMRSDLQIPPENHYYTIMRGWDTPSQFDQIHIGQPCFEDNNSGGNRSMMHSTAAIKYAHVIQDIFVDDTDSKDWYVNVNGRQGGDIVSWIPFNAFEPQIMPQHILLRESQYNYNDMITNAEEYIHNIGGSGYGRSSDDDAYVEGGTRGWIINVTGLDFRLEDLTAAITGPIPRRMFYTDMESYGIKAVALDGVWDSNETVASQTPFILFVSHPIRINPFIKVGQDMSTYMSKFIRMKAINPDSDWFTADTQWETGFAPNIAWNKENEFYTEHGWKNYLYELEYNVDGLVEMPHQIIQHLLASEVGYDIDYFDESLLLKCMATHQGWRLAFTLANEQKPLKEVIEELTSNTKLFPKFRSDGSFSFATIKDYYNMSDVDFNIQSSEVIDWKFDTTKTEDVFSKFQVLYEFDYAKEEFNRSVIPDTIITTGPSGTNVRVWEGYKEITEHLYEDLGKENWLYDIEKLYNKKDEEDIEIVEANYIRNMYTAEEFRRYKMMDNINQHITIDLTLTSKYSTIESGDILYINKLSNELAFGYKYWGFEIKGGQLMYPFWFVTEVRKAGFKIKVKCIQLHRLQYGMPKWVVENTLNDNTYELPDNPTIISELQDDGGIYDLSLIDQAHNFISIGDKIEGYISEVFHLEWYEGDNVLPMERYSKMIHLSVIQSPIYHDEEGMEWTSEVSEDGVTWAERYTDNFYTYPYSNPDYSHNGHVMVAAKTDNDTGAERNGYIRITTSDGTVFQEAFVQAVITDPVEGSGDVNGDGGLNVQDIIMMINYIVGNEDFTEEQLLAADLNGDGVINILDILVSINLILGDQ